MDTIAKKQLVWEVEHALHKSATFDCIVDMIYDAGWSDSQICNLTRVSKTAFNRKSNSTSFNDSM